MVWRGVDYGSVLEGGWCVCVCVCVEGGGGCRRGGLCGCDDGVSWVDSIVLLSTVAGGTVSGGTVSGQVRAYYGRVR